MIGCAGTGKRRKQNWRRSVVSLSLSLSGGRKVHCCGRREGKTVESFNPTLVTHSLFFTPVVVATLRDMKKREKEQAGKAGKLGCSKLEGGKGELSSRGLSPFPSFSYFFILPSFLRPSSHPPLLFLEERLFALPSLLGCQKQPSLLFLYPFLLLSALRSPLPQ